MSDFDKSSTSFWGAIAAAFWFGSAMLRYMAFKKSVNKIEDNNEFDKNKEGMKMEAPKQDIKDVLELLDFGFELYKAGKDIMSGGFHPDKLGELLGVYQKAVPAFDNIQGVIPQLEDMD